MDNNFDENFYTGIFVVEFCSEKKIFFSLSLSLTHFTFNKWNMELSLSISRESFSSHQFMHSHTLFHVCLFALSLFTNNNNNNQFGSVFFFSSSHFTFILFWEKRIFFFDSKKIQNKSKSKLWRLVFVFLFHIIRSSLYHIYYIRITKMNAKYEKKVAALECNNHSIYFCFSFGYQTQKCNCCMQLPMKNE